MPDSIKVLIVDDEPLARDTIRMLLVEHDNIAIIGEAADGDEAVSAIRSEDPDLVFLDIQMPGKSGFEVIETVGAEAMPPVIFATAYDEFALKAFETHALDYLLKPFDDDRFEAALERAVERIQRDRAGELSDRLASLLSDRSSAAREANGANGDRILVRDKDRISFVKTSDVRWIEAAGDYVLLHTAGRKHLVRGTMTGMEERLDDQSFVRIHRSSIVNIDVVREIRPYFHGDYLVYLDDGKELRLSRRYWPRVESRFDARSR